MKGYLYIGKGKRGRYKLAAIRPTIKEAMKLANNYEKQKLLIDCVRLHVMDENGIKYQSTILYRKQ